MNTPWITPTGFGLPDPEIAGGYHRRVLLSRGLDSEEWAFLTNVNPHDTGDPEGSSYQRVISKAHGRYGPENVREVHEACDLNGREIEGYHAVYVRKSALDTARELDPSKAFETHYL